MDGRRTANPPRRQDKAACRELKCVAQGRRHSPEADRQLDARLAGGRDRLNRIQANNARLQVLKEQQRAIAEQIKQILAEQERLERGRSPQRNRRTPCKQVEVMPESRRKRPRDEFPGESTGSNHLQDPNLHHNKCHRKRNPSWVQNLLRRIEELECKIKAEELECKIKAKDNGTRGYENKSPFSPEIEKARFDYRLQLPQLESYDGTTDPCDHVEPFETLMRLLGHSDESLCMLFMGTLRGPATSWLWSLPARSISSFSEFKKQFISRFRDLKR